MLNPIILIRSKFENMKNTATSPYWPTVMSGDLCLYKYLWPGSVYIYFNCVLIV